MQINGKVAVITGGGSGIGRATAQRLAQEGAAVLVVDVDEAGANQTVHLIEEAAGRASYVKADVTDADQTQRAFQAAVDRFGRFDVLHSNAGIGVGYPEFPRADLARWRRVLDIDLQAVVLGTYIAVPFMERQGGVIINTASMAGLYPYKEDPVYAAAKAGVVNFTYSLAPLASRLNIRVNCVCPGVVDTPLVRRGVEAAERIGHQAALPAKLLRPEQIAQAVVQLIVDDQLAGRALEVRPTGVRPIETPAAPGTRH
jgi:15-hydroxyprostaglandin dehydrogenase (NAD)